MGCKWWPDTQRAFYIRNKLVRYGSTFFGPLAFGTSARPAVAPDWPGGGFGCVRMHDIDVRLGRLMPVETRVTIR